MLRAWALGSLVLAGALAAVAQDGAPPVRFVRVELTGPERVLSLAEVQVMRNGRNLAVGGAASQSSVDFDGAAVRAIDGNWDGTFKNSSVTHTRAENDPWWELDLLRAQPVDQITLWPRTDSNWERIEGFRLVLLDEARNVVWQAAGQPSFRSRRDFTPWGAPITRPRPAVDLRERQQLAIDKAIDDGVDWILATQQRDGSWGDSSEQHGPGQTALSLYALLHSGVPRTAPAVVRGFTYLRVNPPRTTYSTACALMAYGALGEAADHARMAGLIEALVDWQGGLDAQGRNIGTWAYPDAVADLSNTQFAILGLRAGQMAGVEVPRNAWLDVLEGVLEYLEKPHDVQLPSVDGRSSSGTRRIAGFRYHTTGGPETASGSMTAAGISSIAICEWALGSKLPRKLREEAAAAKGLASAWLEYHFEVGGNPNLEAWWSWHDYYLYGLERVGALLGTDLIGGHDWYWEGAWNFIARQTPEGDWGGEANTCFALLFLCRATAASSGVTAHRTEHVYVAEDEDADVHWRATGANPVTMFITGFSPLASADYADPDGLVKGLRVVRVEYLADGELMGTVAGHPEAGWTTERYAYQHRFARGGKVALEVRVYVVDPAAASAAQATTVLLADIIEADLGAVLEPWMLDYPEQGARNLLRRAPPRITASSQLDGGRGAEKAVDGLHSTAWIASAEDGQPTLDLEFPRAVRADTILLSHVPRNARQVEEYDRAVRVELFVNRRKEPYVMELSAADHEKGVYRFPKPLGLRSVRIRVVERAVGSRHPGQVGFAEVEFLLAK